MPLICVQLNSMGTLWTHFIKICSLKVFHPWCRGGGRGRGHRSLRKSLYPSSSCDRLSNCCELKLASPTSPSVDRRHLFLGLPLFHSPGFHLNPCLLLLVFSAQSVDQPNPIVLFNYSAIHTQVALEVNSTSGILLSFSEVSMGEHNSRARIAELIHRLLGKTVYPSPALFKKCINNYPAHSAVCFVNTYLLDSDLCSGWRSPAFEQ